MKLDGKLAIVTGGSSGIGAEICRVFKENGAKVVVVARNEPKDESLGEFFKCDATVESEVKKLFETYPNADIVVHSAGITGPNKRVHEMSYDDFKSVFELNVGGAFLVSKYALNGMIERKSGAIINVASVLGMKGSANFDAYAPSKAALIGLTKQLAFNYAKYNIRVNSISPGTVMTELVANIKSEMGEEMFDRVFSSSHPLGGVGSPRDAAQAVLYLATAEWVTGTNLVVDGGFLC